ncbi:MAG TPA: Hpt domain-containing protein [Erysipelotrichaceae bacterium]|nr:Hpt domain-containing protein [Erysipelotrichaceae bacterium]
MSMNREYLITLGIDYDDGLNRFVGNKDMYEKFLLSFKDDPSYAQMLTAIEAKDAKAAFNAAHSLKGLSGNLSMKKLYERVCVLVEELREGDLSHVDESLPPVTAAYQELVDGLK